ncbi:hypothetical protein K4K54_008760 [Colletotrichum sp. SAR 10_86]|nr:hypothetical protein K4K52_007584 [Colletotrichum sp. SAR 10_76]KAI8220258.1 hypothetical protein K4K54_008760 [Colletotrichum sp. SAR 10_86]
MVGVSGFRPDDYLVFFAWLPMGIWVEEFRGGDVLLCDDRLDPEIQQYETRLLFFYRRLVEGQWVEKFIFPVMGLVGATAIAMVLIIFLTCRPITLMWQIRPDPGENCVPQNKVYFYSILAFNLTTDMCIILIPIPVISLVRASIWRRLGVYFLFSLGVFVMTAAIIRVILIFHPTGQFGPGAMWSIREDFVAIFVGQAPMVVPIFKKRFWQQTRIRWTPKSSQGLEIARGPDPATWRRDTITSIIEISNVYRDL